MSRAIIAEKAPAAVGPYVHAVEAAEIGDILFCSGQLGLDPVTGELPEGVEAQTLQSLANMDAVLEKAGYTRNHVVKTTVFIDNMDDFGKINELYANYFGDHKPARSCVEVAKLPKGALVEIECIACK